MIDWKSYPTEIRAKILAWLPKRMAAAIDSEAKEIANTCFFYGQKWEHFDVKTHDFLEKLLRDKSDKEKIAYLKDMLVDTRDSYRNIFQDLFLSLLENDLTEFKILLKKYFNKPREQFLLFFTRFEKYGFNFFHLAMILKRQDFLDVVYFHFLNRDHYPCLHYLFHKIPSGHTYPILWMVFCNQKTALENYLYEYSNKVRKSIDFRELYYPLVIATFFGLVEIVHTLVKALIDFDVSTKDCFSTMVFNVGTFPINFVKLASLLGHDEIASYLQNTMTNFPGNATRVITTNITETTGEEFFWYAYIKLSVNTHLQYVGVDDKKMLDKLHSDLQGIRFFLKFMLDEPTLYLRCYYSTSFLEELNVEKEDLFTLINNYPVEKFSFIIRNFHFPTTFIVLLMQAAVENDNQEKALAIVESFFSPTDKTKEQKAVSFLKNFRDLIAHDLVAHKNTMKEHLQKQCYFHCVKALEQQEPLFFKVFAELIHKLSQNKSMSYYELTDAINITLRPYKSILPDETQYFLNYFNFWLAQECNIEMSPPGQNLLSEGARGQEQFSYTLGST